MRPPQTWTDGSGSRKSCRTARNPPLDFETTQNWRGIGRLCGLSVGVRMLQCQLAPERARGARLARSGEDVFSRNMLLQFGLLDYSYRGDKGFRPCAKPRPKVLRARSVRLCKDLGLYRASSDGGL